jgi:hypothetical protein
MNDIAALQRLDRLIWGMIASTAANVLAAPIVSDFYIEWSSFAARLLASVALVAAGWIPRLAEGPVT